MSKSKRENKINVYSPLCVFKYKWHYDGVYTKTILFCPISSSAVLCAKEN